MKQEPTPGIESAATHLSHSEIDMMKSEPYRVVINKLEDLIVYPNVVYDRILQNFILELAGIDYNLSENKVKGVWYNDKRKIYIAEKRVAGKAKYIACSKDFNTAMKAYIDFCEKNNLPL